jgi:hypothetical protein
MKVTFPRQWFNSPPLLNTSMVNTIMTCPLLFYGPKISLLAYICCQIIFESIQVSNVCPERRIVDRLPIKQLPATTVDSATSKPLVYFSSH